MEFKGECLDDILIELYPWLIAEGKENSSNLGDSLEEIGVVLRLTRPRARVSRSWARGRPLFSALGEFIWYLSGSDDAKSIGRYIPHYIRSGQPLNVSGAYGPRIRSKFGFDQLEYIINSLRKKDGSRRSVIQIYEAGDLLVKDEVPCTTTMQFYRRGKTLHMSVTMRSNDAYIGLPHDVFCFTMIQELVAAELGLDLGEYIHMVGSMHLYKKDIKRACQYTNEGHQKTEEMPSMPIINAIDNVNQLIKVESIIRSGGSVNPNFEFNLHYWSDLARILQTHFYSDNLDFVKYISSAMHDDFYHTFIHDRKGMTPPGERRLEDVNGEGLA